MAMMSFAIVSAFGHRKWERRFEFFISRHLLRCATAKDKVLGAK
jgi:hypothetical protein